MSEWRGLHNPERHNPDSLGYALGGDYLPAFCVWCSEDCGSEDSLCRCCLAAEVEALRVQHGEIVARLTDDLEKATRTIQRVRDRATQMACTRIECDILSCVAYRDILRALDGGADE